MTTARAVLDRAVSEAAWQAVIVKYAQLHGWVVWHDNDSLRNDAGFPDLVLVREGRLIFAELKTETGRIRTAQHAWLSLLKHTAAEVYVWRPSDWPLVEATLR